MTSDPRPPDPAAVARRIERLLAGLQRARRQPNRREAYHLQNALEHLKKGEFVEAEAALLSAERAAPLPGHVAHLLATNRPVTTKELNEQLDRIVRERREGL